MKIFILEDDSLQILRLKLILESIQPNLVIQTFKESDKLLQHITQPDENNIYLLDIELKILGMVVLKLLKGLEKLII